MRGLIFGIAGLLLLASPGICQVDTLQLVEIGSIEAPAEITNLYVEDLDGDSLKEIILTTATNVHIHNGITYEEIWTSPELVNPEDLLFEDINNDGLIDFSVRDSLNISLFDPLNFETVWTSPALDSTYSCYTIGDRNDDDWIDVAIVSKEPFTRPDDQENMDTVWVDIFDGPGYSDEESFVILMENTNYGDPFRWYSVSQIPTRIIICKLSSFGSLENRIVLYSDIDDNSGGHQPNFSAHKDTGNLWLINSDDFSNILIEDIGRLSQYSITTISDPSYLYSLNFFYSDFQHTIPMYSIRRDINTVSADTLIASVTLHAASSEGSYPPDWRGYLMEDIIPDFDGDELSYLLGDSMTLYNINYNTVLWRAGDMISGLYVSHYYSSGVFNYVPIIMCSDYYTGNYLFFDAANGSLRGLLLIPEDIWLSLTKDIDNDGGYELIAREGDLIQIFLAEPLIGLDHQTSNLPEFISLSNYPNPFNSATTIEFGLPEAGHVTIEIYDLLGRSVETLVDEEQEAGTYQVVWDAGNRSSGVYFYRITAGEFAETRRMVLLK